MRTRPLLTALTLAALVAGVGSSTFASAATKHKVVKGSYQVTTTPDPTMDVTVQVGMECENVLPTAIDLHPLTVPAAGTLHVVLDSADPGRGPSQLGTDWDLYILDSAGGVKDSSTGPTAHEETTDVFTGKKNITIKTCNITGEPTATVSWTFTYKK
jgi:hypothetical protein